MTAAPQIEDVLALTPLQEGLFALHRLAEDSPAALDLYSMQFVVDVDGPLDVDLLRRSAQAMLIRHPNLRASFWDHDLAKPVQIIPAEAELPWAERIAAPTEFESIARSERRRPFDLSRGPALRVVLISVPGGTRRRMVFTAHHILMDGWALAVFFTEMLTVYRAAGSSAALPAVRPYRDYIVWLAEQDKALAAARWLEYLQAVPAPLMVADHAVVAGDGLPEKAESLLSAADTARLRNWAADAGLTLSTVVLFAWVIVLGRITDRRDIVFGTVVSGRPEQLTGVDTMIGLFINAVPVAHLITAEAVADQCRRLQRELSAMRDIGYLSLSELQRARGGGTLFDTMFVFENAPIENAIRTVTEPDGTCFRPVEMESLTHYPLTVVAHRSGDELLVAVEAIRAALPHLPAGQIGERILAVLRQLPGAGDNPPGVIDVLHPSERAQLDVPPARSAAGPQQLTVWEMFQRQVSATPDAEALSSTSGQRYTYAELSARAARLAQELAEHGVGPETVVALTLPRSPRTVIAILAVLGAGGAYLPVDSTLPDERIASMLNQADPVLAVTETGCPPLPAAGLRTLVLDDPRVAQRISRRTPAPPAVRRHPQQAAYVIFTSGSTGEPKGVVGTNAALVSYFSDHRERVYRPASARLGRPLRIAHAWSFSFDASWQPMVGLLDGHGLHLFDADELRDADRLVHGIAAHRVDMIDTTPSMFVQLRAAGLVDEPAVSVLALGGEAIDPALWQQLRTMSSTSRIDVYNCYGPTETTVEAVVAPVHRHPEPELGTPNAGSFGYVLDSELRMAPSGVVGELYLSGAQLARGYVGGPAMTAAGFVADPFRPGRRMYRTGDLVRRLPHGGYAYVGRADSQVKIRGYRVEVNEVEAALRDQPEVADAAVSVVRRMGGAGLVGFVVLGGNGARDAGRLRSALYRKLPQYMVPARVVALPRLPVNANGKLDRHALDRLADDALAIGSGGQPAMAATDTERTLCEVFREQFNGATPGLDDDFFTLGLDSIITISLVHKARRRGLSVSPRMVFTASTIRRLATAIDDVPEMRPVAAAAEYGAVLPLPIVSWLNEYGNFRRFTHTVLLRLPPGIERSSIESVLQLLLDGHDMLRSRLTDGAQGPSLVTRPPGAVRAGNLLTQVRLASATDAEFASGITRCARDANEAIDPRRGAMMRAVLISGDRQGDVLLITGHHLALDVVSWHIMLGDIAAVWDSVQSGSPPKTLPEFTSYRRWSELLWKRAATAQVTAQRDYWIDQVSGPDPALGRRQPDPGRDTWSSLRVSPVVTPVDITACVLDRLGGDAGVREFLLTVTAMTIASWRRARAQDPSSGTLVALENHGRADPVLETDTTNTVGWFNTMFPLRLGAGNAVVDVERAENDPAVAASLLDAVAADLSRVPYQGLDYGLLRYVRRTSGLQAEPQIIFSYLGRLDLAGVADQPWSMLTGPYLDALPIDPEPDLPLRFALNISGLVGTTARGSQLITNLRWSAALFAPAEIDQLADLWRRGVTALAAGLHGRDGHESSRR